MTTTIATIPLAEPPDTQPNADMGHTVKILLEDADFLPRRAKPTDSGFDLFAGITIVCLPGKMTRVPLGLRAELPPGYECQIRPKSGYTSQGILIQFGTIDEDFRGKWEAVVFNSTEEPYTFSRAQKVAQAVFARRSPIALEVTTQPLSITERGEGGFGSTGLFAASTTSDKP